jgi:hypothetical protein
VPWNSPPPPLVRKITGFEPKVRVVAEAVTPKASKRLGIAKLRSLFI